MKEVKKMKLLKWMKQLKKTEKPCNQTDLEKDGIWSPSPATNPRIFLDLLVKGEKHVITRRSTYQKIYKTRFQGTQVEALKDIHFTVEKGGTWLSWGNRDLGNRPFSISWPCWISRPKGGSTSTVPILQLSRIKDASKASVGEKLGFVFQDFNLLDTLSIKDNILLPLVLSRRPVKEMMTKIDSVSRGWAFTSFLRNTLTKSLVGKNNGWL